MKLSMFYFLSSSSVRLANTEVKQLIFFAVIARETCINKRLWAYN